MNFWKGALGRKLFFSILQLIFTYPLPYFAFTFESGLTTSIYSNFWGKQNRHIETLFILKELIFEGEGQRINK